MAARRARATGTANTFRAALVALSLLLVGAVGATVRSLRQKQGELAHLAENLEARVVERTRDLQVSREQYRTLVESTQAIPWEMEPASIRFSYVGPQAVRILGYPAAAYLEEGFLDRHLHPDDVASALATLTSAPPANDHELEMRVIAADGQWLWLRSLVSTFVDAAGRPIRRGIFLDVTSRRRLEPS